MLLALFNIFSLVSNEFYVLVIFVFYVVKIYGMGLGRHGPTKARCALGPSRAAVSTVWVDTTRPKFFGPYKIEAR
jgi:hypothetical protein